MGPKRTTSITVKMTAADWELLERAAEILWPRAPITKSSLLLTLAKLHAEGIIKEATAKGLRATFDIEMAKETAYQDLVRGSMSGIAREELLQRRLHDKEERDKEAHGQLVIGGHGKKK
jgi:hypothetical protein